KTVVSLTAPAAASPSVIDPSSARIRGSRQIQLVVHLSREFSVDCPDAWDADACCRRLFRLWERTKTGGLPMPLRFMRSLSCAAFAAAALAGMATAAHAQIPGDKIKIGVLSDFSGPFADQVGKGSLVGAQLAAEDFAKEAGGLSVEIVSADHQNK